MKIILSVISLFFILNVYAQQTDTTPAIRKPENKVGRLKENPTTPRHTDKEVTPSSKDRMPVLKTDTNIGDKMPVDRPKEDHAMPVKNLSDSLKK